MQAFEADPFVFSSSSFLWIRLVLVVVSLLSHSHTWPKSGSDDSRSSSTMAGDLTVLRFFLVPSSSDERVPLQTNTILVYPR
jgi:hypothetical protein